LGKSTGGAGLISTFLNHDLIDEMRITVNPVVIGGGIPLFKEINNRKNLRLINTRTYRCGVVGLYYEPIRDVIQ
jgi:Dihydrofolate reductase